jgi:biopolymer transport protein ExbD
VASLENSSDDELFSGINVTPLVDVVLVLLVIFLMTAPVIYQSAIKVQLPKARSGEATEKTPYQFTVTKDGGVMWDQKPVDWETLEKKLAAMGTAGEQTAMISADQQTPHGSVIRLMDTLRRVGLTRFALNVDSSK